MGKEITIGFGDFEDLIMGLREIGKVDFEKGFKVKEFSPEYSYIVIEK